MGCWSRWGNSPSSGAWQATGHRGVGRLLEELWRVDPAHAKHLVAHAEHTLALVALSGQTLPARLARAAAIAAAGEIGEEHLRVLVRARGLIERIVGLAPERVAEAEELLAEAARSLSPSGLQRVVDQLLATLDQDGAAPEEDPEPVDELLLTHRRDGTLAFTGRVHGVADVELLLETLDALSTPAGPDDPRSLAQRRAEALLDLCGQARGPEGIADPADDPAAPDPFGDDPVDEDAYRDLDWRDHRDEDSDASRRHGWLRPVPDPAPGPRRLFTPPPPEPPEPEHDASPAPRRSTEPPGSEKPPGTEEPSDPGARSEAADPNSDAPPDPPDHGAPAEPPGHSTPLEPAPTLPLRSGRRGSVLPIPARAQIALTIPLEWLREQTGHAQLDSGRALDPATARRLACDGNIIPVVLGTRSEPVELGRASYVVTEALRRLLTMRDRGCAHPGCTRRPNRTHAHHILTTSSTGATAGSPSRTILSCSAGTTTTWSTTVPGKYA
ncbi:DUF222 domain-containing protein [Actinomycetospora endophytica]|uniref:DUF222 domain-containing protein n=1 Tax=Actinomycetospora endophytica TaxID=2291215 RepID=A0ABS8PEY8_9PSEU|nr:DUF222 domain-containing protein [Actinomycetospora endophytica]MCD2196836.1 DUF222 domain-containing protein [Actinomycetospora endophytica]